VGFEEPLPIQEHAIAPLLAGRDVIGQAKTGTGKTAAFGLPMLQKLDPGARHVQGLVLAPTRELAVQITHELGRLGRYTGLRAVTIYGGQSIEIQLRALAQGAHIVVGTPGRVIDMMERGALRLERVRFAVLDEADTMLDMGFIEDVERILRATPPTRQLSLFSATMPQEIIRLASRFMRHPESILIDSDEPSVGSLEQFFTFAEDRDKLARLVEILKSRRPRSTIVFCRTKERARLLSDELQQRFRHVVALHGDLRQHQRDVAMAHFRGGHADILVATDVAARGLDIPQVSCVINYDVPQHPLMYFHRVGRTARVGNPGLAIMLVAGFEYGDFQQIQTHTKVPIKPLRPQDEHPDPHTFHVQPRSSYPRPYRSHRWESRPRRREQDRWWR
jgi:ATP-dependent RNA helicase DeaD